VRRVPPNATLKDLVPLVRDLQRDLDRVTGGDLTIRGDLDMRNYRILNIGNPEDFGASAATVATDTTTTTVTGDIGISGSPTAYGLTYWVDTTTLGSLGTGATTQILVGGGSAVPVWTTATGSGSPVRATSPTLVTPALGTPSSGVLTNCTGTASGLTAGTVTTNANLTGPITSVGNATSVASQTGTGSTFAMSVAPQITGGMNVTGALNVDSGAFSIDATQRIGWAGSATGGWNTRQDGSGNLVYAQGTTDFWQMQTAGASLRPVTAGGGSIGSVALGVSSVFLDEAGAGTETAQIIAPALSGDIVLTTPAATSTLTGQSGALTITRVPFVTTGGLLTDDAGFTYDAGTNQITANLVGEVSSPIVGINGATDAYISFDEDSTTPPLSSSGTQIQMYMKSNKIIFKYNDGGTTRYKYLDMTGTGVTWVHDTVGP
jgi:hypothetical protein